METFTSDPRNIDLKQIFLSSCRSRKSNKLAFRCKRKGQQTGETDSSYFGLLEHTSGFNHNPVIWAMLRVDEQTGITKITPDFRLRLNNTCKMIQYTQWLFNKIIDTNTTKRIHVNNISILLNEVKLHIAVSTNTNNRILHKNHPVQQIESCLNGKFLLNETAVM